MRLVSVNTGGPREVIGLDGRAVLTSIWKSPRDGRVAVRTLNLDGDEQSDLSAHGGQYKAVYCYPSEHYEWWKRQLPDLDLPWGVFGENLTTAGLGEAGVQIGDRFAIGTAVFQVTQPRQPCFKLGIRFSRADMVKRFVESGRSGFYVSVVREGEIGAGDPIHLVERARESLPVSEIFALHFDHESTRDRLERAAAIERLSPGWRDNFRKRSQELSGIQ